MRSIRTIGAVAMTAALCHTRRTNPRSTTIRALNGRPIKVRARGGQSRCLHQRVRSAAFRTRTFERRVRGCSCVAMRASSAASTIAGCEPPAPVREGPSRRTEAAR
jgi:hypothetical protein